MLGESSKQFSFLQGNRSAKTDFADLQYLTSANNFKGVSIKAFFDALRQLNWKT